MLETAAKNDSPDRQRRRAAIKEVALRLILERGIAGAQMKDLAAAAGIARKTLYRYYANIEELARDLLADITASPDFFGPDQIVRGHDGLDSFCQTTLAYADYCLAHIDVIKFYYEYDYYFREPSLPQIHAFWKNRPHIFQMLLEAGIADGSIDIDPAEAHAISLVVDNAILAVTQKLILREQVYRLECDFTRNELRMLPELLLAGLVQRGQCRKKSQSQ